MPSLAVRSLVCLVGAGAGLAVLSCADDPKPTGAVMLAISTNMRAPKDVDSVGLRITSNGVPIFDDTRQVAPTGEVRFPATLAVLAAPDPRAVVKIRLVAFRGNDARILRDVITTVPHDRIALLRLPIQWVSDGSGIGDLQVPLSEVRSACGDADETTIDGRCASAVVDSSTLPTYSEPEVFGGAPASTGEGTCFDTRACFGAASVLDVDLDLCTVQVPSGVAAEALNLAIRLPPGSDGECLEDRGCFIPLEGNEASGWTIEGSDDPATPRTVRILGTVCARIREGRALGVSASTGCTTKAPAVPVCGEASAVNGAPVQPMADAGPGIPPADADRPDVMVPEPPDSSTPAVEDFASVAGLRAMAATAAALFVVNDDRLVALDKATKTISSASMPVATGTVRIAAFGTDVAVLNTDARTLQIWNQQATTTTCSGMPPADALSNVSLDATYAFFTSGTNVYSCNRSSGIVGKVESGGTANVCGGTGTNCVPRTVVASCAPTSCGLVADGCGGIINCGGCSAGESCGTGGVPNTCSPSTDPDGGPPPACVPTSCSAQAKNCGLIGDGCGAALNCGTCSAPLVCSGGRAVTHLTTSASPEYYYSVNDATQHAVTRCPTFSGSGCSNLVQGPSELPGPLVAGGSVVYYLDGAGKIVRLPSTGGATTLATGQNLADVVGQTVTWPHRPIALAGSYVFFLDRDGNVRAVKTTGGAVTTLATDQTGAMDLSVDATHAYWIVPARNRIVRARTSVLPP